MAPLPPPKWNAHCCQSPTEIFSTPLAPYGPDTPALPRASHPRSAAWRARIVCVTPRKAWVFSYAWGGTVHFCEMVYLRTAIRYTRGYHRGEDVCDNPVPPAGGCFTRRLVMRTSPGTERSPPVGHCA